MNKIYALIGFILFVPVAILAIPLAMIYAVHFTAKSLAVRLTHRE